jgi:ATP-binding cassette subfamily C protein
MFAVLRDSFALVPPAMRWRWGALVPLLLLTALFEAVGAAAVFALIKVLTDPAQAATVPVASALVRRLPRQDDRMVVLVFTTLVALFYLAKNALAAASAYARGRCLEEAAAATATRLLRGYLAAPYAFHLRRNSAQLIHGAGQAVERAFGSVLGSVLGVFTEGLVAVAIVAVLLAAAPRPTLVAASALLGLSLLFLRLTRRSMLLLGARVDELGKATLRHLQQALGAIKEVKVLGREQFFADAFARDQAARARVRYLYATFATLPRLVVETVFVSGAMLVVLLVAAGGGTGTESVPLLGLYAYAGFRVIPSANRIVWLLSEIRFGRAALDRVRGDLALMARYLPAGAAEPADSGLRFDERLDLERVSYTYEQSAKPVIADLSLTIRRGESIGIVGPTGVGKSTLVDLLVGLLEPTAGRLAVDGVDIRTHLASWQRQIGYVPQSVFLVDDTLRRNVALGIPDREIDARRLQAATQQAQLDAVIASLPDGLDTVVGERGVRLSGGERQRVGIARALYHQPAVLVFDEATSALDSRTEAELTRAIEALRGDTTLVLVAHRLSSVRHCDRLVLLRDGRIADSGTFDELVARNADFRATTGGSG